MVVRIEEIASDTLTAGQQVIDAAFKLQDEGRKIREIAEQIRWELVDPGALKRTIYDLDRELRNLNTNVEDALSMLRRLPYEGANSYR